MVIDRPQSHLHATVLPLLSEALLQINAGEEFIQCEVPMGRVVGKSICVATRPGDDIVYAKRPKRWGHTRFAKNREPEDSSSVVIVLKKAEDNTYILITAFIGSLSEPEPWDRKATQKSRAFWDTHALVWGHEETLSGTETRRCPW